MCWHLVSVEKHAMNLQIEVAILTVAAVLGALFAAVMGWLESGEAFNGRKFASSVLRAVIAGILIAVGYQYVSAVDALDYLIVFLAGCGVDAVGNRAAGAIKARAKPS